MSIKRWFIGKLKKALREYDENPHVSWAEKTVGSNSVGTRQSLRSDGMEFTLYNADGGWVLEYHSYDHVKDESINRIHIIQDNQDFGIQISNILTMELLRR